MDKFESRWKKAVEIANTINWYLVKGFIVFDKDRRVVGKFVISDSEIMETIGDNSFMVYFSKDPDLDIGMHTNIEDYQNQFKNWIAVHPSNFQSIL